MYLLPRTLCRHIATPKLCLNFLEIGTVSLISRPFTHLGSNRRAKADLKESTMASNADLERVKARAAETEAILSNLESQIEAIRKAAVKQASLGEEERLAKENEVLKKEVESLKTALILAEVGNGVRQIHVPSREAAASMIQPPSESEPSKPAEIKTESKPKKVKEETAAPSTNKKAKTEIKKEAKGKTEGESGKGKAAGGDGDGLPVDISRLEMRVGKIVGVEKHPDADSLYVEQVDLGEGKIRTIISGLVKHVPINAMRDRVAVFMCNLKPAKMRGILSEGMIMCASTPEKTEILVPPATASIGDRVFVKEFPGNPDAMLNPKKKIWETLKPDVRTNKDRVATYKGGQFIIEGKGVVVAPTLMDAQIS